MPSRMPANIVKTSAINRWLFAAESTKLVNSNPSPVMKITPMTIPAQAHARATVTVFFAPSSSAFRIFLMFMYSRVVFLRSAVGMVLMMPQSAAKGALKPSISVPIMMISGRNR